MILPSKSLNKCFPGPDSRCPLPSGKPSQRLPGTVDVPRSCLVDTETCSRGPMFNIFNSLLVEYTHFLSPRSVHTCPHIILLQVRIIYMNTCIYIYCIYILYIYIYAYMHIYSIYICICIYIYMHTSVHTMYIALSLLFYSYVYTYVHLYIHTIHIYIYICIS